MLRLLYLVCICIVYFVTIFHCCFVLRLTILFRIKIDDFVSFAAFGLHLRRLVYRNLGKLMSISIAASCKVDNFVSFALSCLFEIFACMLATLTAQDGMEKWLASVFWKRLWLTCITLSLWFSGAGELSWALLFFCSVNY